MVIIKTLEIRNNQLGRSWEIYNKIDYCIFKSIWLWICHRHPHKSAKWKINKYFRSEGLRKWIFFARKVKVNKNGIEQKNVDLFSASNVKIKRHTIIQSAANPYDPNFMGYFEKRGERKISKDLKRQTGLKCSDIHTKWLGHTYGF